jgi:trehalose-6-phosphatase
MAIQSSIEIKWADIHKGKAAAHLLEGIPHADFVLAIGDDRTAEDLFATILAEQWSMKVGTGFSAARFSLSTPADVLELLRDLVGNRSATRRQGGTVIDHHTALVVLLIRKPAGHAWAYDEALSRRTKVF